MKRRILVLATVVLSLLLAIGISTFAASAEEAEPSVSIEKFNLAFEDNTYLKYAVKFTGVDDAEINADNIGMLYWTDYADGFVPGTEDYSSETTGYTTISGVKHYVFEYTHLAAKQLTDYIYSVAYIELDGTTYYSEPVKYSALEYAYNRLGKTSEGSTNTELKALLNNMLAYGASAQQYFDYKEDRLATDDFYQITLVGGTLADGFTSELVLSTDKITITAPEITEAGNSFVSWIDESGFVVSESREFTASDIKKNSVYSVLDSSMVAPSREGLEYTVNADGVSCTVTGLGTYSDTEVYIPEYIDDYKVTTIGEKAFADEATLTKIVLPETTKTIGTRAFYGCTGLTEMTIPASVTSIGTQIFYKASNLNTVYYNSTYSDSNNPFLNTASIKKVVFGGNYVPGILSGCTNISEVAILDGVASIGYEAFEGCSSLTSIVIPDSVTSIRGGAFGGCSSLVSIVIPDSVTSIDYDTFEGCSLLASIEIPSSVTSIGGNAFKGCCSLTSIVIPSSITSIGYSAFEGCSSLTSVVISDSVTSMGNQAFCRCSSLTSIVIPDSVTSIGTGAFRECSSLTSVVIPNNVTSIGEYVFYHCTLLTSIEIPDSVTGIGTSAFEGCSSLTNIAIPNSVTSIGTSAFSRCSSLVSIVIPDSVMNIDDLNFSGCSSLTSIEIPDSAIINGGLSFSGCSSLVSIVIHDGVIVESAFSGCSALTSVVIGESVTSIGEYAFTGCSSLTCIAIDKNNSKYKDIDGNLYTKDGKTLIQYSVGKLDNVFEIPDGVTSIGDYAFYNCSSLTSVAIPDSVANIGQHAFSGCSSLISVEMGNNVTCIDSYAFYGCSSITSIEIPNGVTAIWHQVFSGCSALTSVVIPDSVTSIGYQAFYHCSELTRIEFGGTKEQWDAISKYSYWDHYAGYYTVYCEDGEISK